VRLRGAAVVLALAAVGLTAVAVAAWVSSPSAGGLAARLQARLHGTGGRAVSLDAVAPILREAVVATEDERFYGHHGIDVIGVLRALPYDVVHLSFAQGASTITEQVGKLLYLGGNDHTPWRKLEDAALALKLERRYSKEQILAAYLDSAYFGDGAYGIRAASERYFGIPPARLGTAEASLLAGLIQAPTADDPLVDPTAARARQEEVLRSLVRDGFVTADEAAAAIGKPLRLRGGRPLPAVRGVDFAPGPAFVWWGLGFGLAIAAAGAAVLVGSRTWRLRPALAPLAVRLVSVVLVLAGTAEIVRSFRSA
jgi:membrane peptidoglycan carboxypeptidase